jgi:type I restriction enzyme R subunit
LVKKIESDPEFDTKKARKKLRKYVESHDHAIRLKAEIMADRFLEQVLALNKIGGQARAMVVCSGIERAIQYFHAIKSYLVQRKSPYQAIVAFSGEPEHQGVKVTETSLNGFPANDIANRIQEDPYRFLVCADKFQTGYDEPLLHTMYVDKPLSGIKAVQTLSRLNRAHPQKHDVFVLDFMNNAETITAAFSDYYRTTILSEEMDSYRVEKQAALKVLLPDEDAEIEPVPVSGGGRKPEPELDRLSNILKSFNDQIGTLFTDADRIVKRIKDDIAPTVAADQPYQNAKKNTPNAARIELDAALMRVIGPLLKDDTEFYKQFVQNESFRRFVTEMVSQLTTD